MTPDVFMHRCIELATQGRGRVGNGAMVGAVLVRGGKIIAENFHAEFAGAHAEAALLASFSSSIEPDDTLCVNLEPCCHQGKTPPCTDAIIARGIRRVICGMPDPDPRVAGKGIAALRAAGVDVQVGVERAWCERLNRGFIRVRTKGRPWITLKGARTRSGDTAGPDGSRLKITDAEQDAWSHTFLRAQLDAIMIGVGTATTDSPSLNTRFAQNERSILNTKVDQFNPLRIVLDPHLNISENEKILSSDHPERTILAVTAGAASSAKARTLRNRGVTVLAVEQQHGQFSFSDLWRQLLDPALPRHGITSILLEGGPTTWALFRAAGVIDEEVSLVGAV